MAVAVAASVVVAVVVVVAEVAEAKTATATATAATTTTTTIVVLAVVQNADVVLLAMNKLPTVLKVVTVTRQKIMEVWGVPLLQSCKVQVI